MPSRTLITDSKISNQARISPQKIAPADESSFLIAQKDKKYQSKKIHGDGTVDSNGKLTIVQPSVSQVVEESLPNGTVKVGTSSGKNEYVKLGSKAGEIAVRDVNGDLHARSSVHAVMATTATRADTAIKATKANIADKADLATNADDATLLNGDDADYYRNVAHHVAEAETTSTDSYSNEITHKKTPHKVFEFEVPNDSGSYLAGTASNYPIEFTHNCGYIPDVSVYYKSNNALETDPWLEVDADIQNTATTTKVQISAQNAHLKIIAK